METPSSARRVTRSQTLAASNNSNTLLSGKVEETTAKPRQTARKQHQDRSPLIDITNDSPIVGIAMGNVETPSSSALSKKRVGGQGQVAGTPGSGEVLLRCQVKTLLQKVEEEAEMSKIALENRPLFCYLHSPMNPTPANTPQVLNLSADAEGLPSLTPSPVNENFPIPQMLHEKKEQGIVAENLITRSLMLDFTEKLEGSDSSECSSMLTYQGAILEGRGIHHRGKASTDDDDAPIWSLQVNPSSATANEEEDGFDENENDDGDFQEDDDFSDDHDGLINGLCEGISKISVREGPKFLGKHVRFVYNSDDELQGEEEVSVRSSDDDSALHLKGLPMPKGKHLRFPQEDNSA